MRRSRGRVVAGALALGVSLAACGDGSQRATVPHTAGSAIAQYTGPLSDVTFRIAVPGPATAAKARRPSYVSSATKSIGFAINAATLLTPAQIVTFNAQASTKFNVGTLPNATCPASGADFVCTVAVKLPPGSDTVTMAAFDGTSGTGNVLSQQVQTFAVVAGAANTFSVVLDANVKAPATDIVISGSGSCQAGPIGASFGSVGTSPITFTITARDAQGKAIVAPGLPKIAIADNASTYQTSSGTIAGTGGTVAFAINQAAQTFTLTPSNSSTTNANVSVRVTQADSNGASDGLAYNHTQAFAFSTGAAPPAHNFLAVVEQTGTNTGAVDFFNVTLGGSGGPDSFSAFSPAQLAQTNSTNEGKPDVDNPLSVAWDATGDLLIGNSNDGGPSHGNMACVPVGAIATGANTSTTISNVTVPVGIAYDSRDGSVAIANNVPTATYTISEYVLSGNYVAAPPARNIKIGGTNVGNNAIVNIPLPSLNVGTFAAAITDGIEIDPAHNGNTSHISKIVLFSPDGTATDVVSGASGTACSANPCALPAQWAIDGPTALAYDKVTNQLIIANSSIWHKQLSFYTIGGSGNAPVATQTKVMIVGSKQFNVAASADGHVAFEYNDPGGSGLPLVQVLNTAANNRAAIGGPIPYDGMTDAGTCSNPVYSYGATVKNLEWLSNSKLLVGLHEPNVPTLNGLYVYDITAFAVPGGYDPNGCAAFSQAAPKNTGFTQITKGVQGTAFKP